MELFGRIFCLLLFFGPLQGQPGPSISLRSAADTVALGEPFIVEIDLKVPKKSQNLVLDFTSWTSISNTLYPKDTIFYSKTASVDILSSSPWKQLGQVLVLHLENAQNQANSSTNQVRIAIFEAGEFLLPAPRLQGADSAAVVYGRPVIVFVRNPVPPQQIDSLSLRPIRDIHREPAHWTDYIWYLMVLAVIILLLLAYWWWKRKPKTVRPEPAPPAIPAWEAALSRLHEQERQELWQQGMIKEYQDQLTTILRSYLEDRFGIAAPELTTDEITSTLSLEGMPSELVQEVRDVLQVADLVKFARATPEDDIHSRFMQRTIRFVNHTIPPARS
jgi:hypothetical protein